MQAIPPEVSNNYELTQITLDYKCECKADNVVESLATPENTETAEAVSLLLEPKYATVASHGTYPSAGSNGKYSAAPKHSTLLFLHVLRLTKVGREINRGRTEWRIKHSPQES